MKPEPQQIFSPIFNTLNSKFDIENKTKAGQKLEKEIAKTLNALTEDINAVVKKRIIKEDRQMVKEMKRQQKKLRKEKMAAVVAELLKSYHHDAL